MDITFVQSFNFQIIRQEFVHIDTTSMPLKVLVLGHSFVRRLETDIINQVHPVLSPNLGLVNSDVVVQYLGFSGGNIFSLLDDPNNRLDATLRAFPADVIVLQIGGNDIDQKEFDILLHKASVRHLIFRLQELYQVKKVVICGIFPRFKLRMVKLDVYHEKKEKINLDFNLEFFHDPQIHFWRHGSGLMSNRDLFRRDGVHLNENVHASFFAV